MKELPINYAVHCETAEETTIVNNIIDDSDSDTRAKIEISLEQFKQYYNLKTMKEIKLTREQLVTLYEADRCSDWKNEIKKILSSNVLTNEFVIPQSSIDYLVKDGSDTQKKLVTDFGIELPKSPKEIYLENQANCGLKIGDKVKITRKAETGENGWDNSWVDSMDENVGKIVTIISITDKGVLFNEIYKTYPYFILEKVVEEWIPFTFEDDLLGKQVIAKDKSCKGIITYQDQNNMLVGEFTKSYFHLLENYTFIDESPCGKLKQ